MEWAFIPFETFYSASVEFDQTRFDRLERCRRRRELKPSAFDHLRHQLHQWVDSVKSSNKARQNATFDDDKRQQKCQLEGKLALQFVSKPRRRWLTLKRGSQSRPAAKSVSTTSSSASC